MEIKKTTVLLPKDLVRQAKLQASAEGISLNALIIEGLRRVLPDEPISPTARQL
jgi:predicted HicB family RNase H-like nuclease